MPSDVRKVCDRPGRLNEIWGYAPELLGRSPKILWVTWPVGRSRHRTSAGGAVGETCRLRTVDFRLWTFFEPSVHGAGVALLTGFDAQRQSVLRRRQGTGRVVSERAGWTVSLVKVNHHFPVRIRRRYIKVTSGAVGFASGSFVGNHHKPICLAFFQDRINPISFAVNFKRQGAGRSLIVGHAQHVGNRNNFRRLIRFNARFDAPLRIDGEILEAFELAARSAFSVLDPDADAVAAFDHIDNE